jgi:cell division protein ZapA
LTRVISHSIRVLGRDLQVKSTASSEHVAEVEALVNTKLSEAEASLSGQDTQLVVILTLMNLAEELISAREKSEEQGRLLMERVGALLTRMDVQGA